MHEISNNVVCATSKAADQPAHTKSDGDYDNNMNNNMNFENIQEWAVFIKRNKINVGVAK